MDGLQDVGSVRGGVVDGASAVGRGHEGEPGAEDRGLDAEGGVQAPAVPQQVPAERLPARPLRRGQEGGDGLAEVGAKAPLGDFQ